MSEWSLENLLAGLHDDIEQRLATARKAMGHPVAKGDASEGAWLELLKTHLPTRYAVEKAFVVDSNGKFSDQLDVVVFDRQYSPLIFAYQGQTIIPAESVYAVMEAKQSINADQVKYAQAKIASVRRLHRTSLPIPHAGGTYDARPLQPILGGFLSFESDWKPALDKPLHSGLIAASSENRIDIGCVAAHGAFWWDNDKDYVFVRGGKPATAFLLELIARLQVLATAPMIDIRAYANWLPK